MIEVDDRGVNTKNEDIPFLLLVMTCRSVRSSRRCRVCAIMT